MFVRRIIFIFTSAALVAAPFSFAMAQSQELQSALQDVSNTVGKISEPTASTTPAQAQELSARKTALISVYTFTLVEVVDLKKKVQGIKNDSGAELWDIHNNFLATLDGFAKDINDLKLAAATSNSISDVKTMATDFKSWRETIYNPTVQQLLDLLLLAQGRKVLNTADGRFAKVATDVKRIQLAIPVGSAKLQAYLTLAGKNIREAKALYEKGQAQFVDAIQASVASALSDDASSSPMVSEQASSGPLLVQTDLASSSPVVIEPDVHQLLSMSLGKVSDTYKIFLEMSALAKKLLAAQG
jgi:hypothetical protein